MGRQSSNEWKKVNGVPVLWNGYDYGRQVWILNGKYIRCGHPEDMKCNCYGKLHEGEASI